MKRSSDLCIHCPPRHTAWPNAQSISQQMGDAPALWPVSFTITPMQMYVMQVYVVQVYVMQVYVMQV